MPEPQLSIRSARARTLAYRLAKKQKRTLSQVVELALEAYAKTEPPALKKMSDGEFWKKMNQEHALDDETFKAFEDAIAEQKNLPARPVEL